MRKGHLLARRNLTRAERKKQILLVFDVPRKGGKLNGLTAQKIATEIGMLSDDLVRELCKELVESEELYTTSGVHRQLKNGLTIDKIFYWRKTDEEGMRENSRQLRLWLDKNDIPF